MAILALEPDPARAATIRHIVCDLLHAELRLVQSKDRLLDELSIGIPDVLLVPALLSSADETELLARLSTIRESGHVEILMTPFRFASSEDMPRVAPSGWRQWFGQGQSNPPEQDYACDPRDFAEKLSWSLQRAQQVRQERAELYQLQDEQQEVQAEQHEMEAASASSLQVVTPDAPASTDATTVAPVQGSDRRAHRRFAADELYGLRSARIEFGPDVRLVDCSEGGALIESDVPLMPESEATLELIGDSQKSTVPFRVVRCHVSNVESRLLYWGACAFTRPLELADLLRPKSNDQTTADDHVDRFDIAVKAIVERNVSPAEGEAGPGRSARAGQVRELLTLLREVSRARPADPGEHSIKDVLGIVIAALERGDKQGVAHMLIEERLDAALPWLAARFAAAPALPTTADTEALYLNLPTRGGTPSRVLNVELPKGSMLEDWQFRLLKASAYLAALLEPTRADEGRDRRRHARIRGRFEGRQLGAINMRILIHDISETGCFVDSYHEERSGRRLTLEVHLPDDGWITVQAEVVCSRPGGFAVQFIDTSEETRTRLARFVAARAGSVASSGPASDLLGNTAEGSPAPLLTQSMIA